MLFYALGFRVFNDSPNNISAAIRSRLTGYNPNLSTNERSIIQQFLETYPNEDYHNGKKGRGITKGISVRKKIKKTQNRKLDITIHPRRNRIVGENAAEFKIEASAILKQHAPMQYARWKKIPTDRKKMLWLAIKQKFNLQVNVEIKKVVFEQLNRQYRSLRHKLHDHYAKNKDDEKIFEQPPDGITVENWQVLIDYFESDEFKITVFGIREIVQPLLEALLGIGVVSQAQREVSDRNKRNRDKLKMAHTCGTKSIAQYCYEEEDIMKLKNEGGVDTESPVSEVEAFIKVLRPEKPSRLRGCRDGLKPPSKRGESINQELAKENEELRKQADADR
ncbi:phosphoglucan phosphatase dsp4 amyloplastic [Phtheirospermum japonicum]|uniref:Phosphoglucan phosphatase dsp4 amyloplastic n=1 Tax=Phtheirospermum japonicum TaxID=374723 RepID=A0A830D8R3_9LAMI|nr:phosphoglucan phosphatase dsp4 amyloplastic [Phtheirospermum japonicum]